MSKKQIAIAIQGGGVQSAFAWGVVDLFLQDSRLEITGVSTTGLGGLFGAALIQGLALNDRALASQHLRDYWLEFYKISEFMSPLLPNPLDKIVNYYSFSHGLSHSELNDGISPYDKNPLNINPVLDFINGFFDFGVLNHENSKKLFISTTHVESGKIQIFSNPGITPKVLMASFCLPYIFHAVEIDGEYYWDGGLIANPAINPIINGVPSKDIVVIQLSKTTCSKLPRSYSEIDNRMKEISYNGHLLREMRAIYFISKLIDDNKVVPGALKRINMHVVRNNESDISEYPVKTFSSDWGFIMDLYTAGYNAAKRWLVAHYDSIENNHSELSDEVFGAYL